ncbi:hypothetical protein LOTGIDRAFT_123335 [Lottia gigantea]|uniref:GPI transamidase component PIG-S n=1 Tax=Lottia gigantea TaxID=225164 RepID=V3ZH37_LOTGI|nr:hypothetical protein LOTGIDRAFT_123335 [Lottia gigantea]ESO90553.1 hypothetical protein LOTGIDRAFT_123335 [Lottia gigantea]
MAESKHEEDEKANQAYAALGIGIICIIIGVPLWWKTTEVYRVQLPYNDISDLSQIPLVYLTDIEVISLDKKLDSNLVQISQQLQEDLSRKRGEEVTPIYRVTVRESVGDEQSIFNKYDNKDLSNIDKLLSELSPLQRNKYLIFLIPSNNGKLNVFIGKYYNSFVSSNGKLDKIIPLISKTVQMTIVKEQSVVKSIFNAKGARSLKPDKESMRSVRYNTGYDLTFTLTVPQPDIFDVSWNIREAVDTYLKPLVDHLKEFTQLKINSQIHYFTTLQRKPQKDEKLNEYYFLEQDLPHLINPIESTLGTSASNNPELNFIVYIPTRDQSPLYIKDKNGVKVPTNSFLSPRWGGVMIFNVPEFNESTPLPFPVKVEGKNIMEVFLTQIRLLLNLNSPTSSHEVWFDPVEVNGISNMEIDVWLRNRCFENLATSINTLQSLAQLLGQISNIVIKDDIGSQVEAAVREIKSSLKYLSTGNLVDAFHSSKRAIIASEKAFFDPSLLELLYFPEDQKFAIYIPLFLPISIPLITAMMHAIKWFKGTKKPKTD